MTKTTTLDVTLNVSGMKCGGCESNVTTRLSDIDGIINVNANHKEDLVNVEYDETTTNLDEIKQAIVDVEIKRSLSGD